MSRILITAAALAWLTTGAQSELAQTAWPTYRADAAHTGQSRALTHPAPEKHWGYRLQSSSQTGVMVGPHGDLYFGTNAGEVISVDRSGVLLWSYRSQGPIRSAPCLTMDNWLYFGSFDGCVYGLQARTGTLRWTYCIDRPVSSPIVVDNQGNLYFGATDNIVRSLDPNGELRWEYLNQGAITAASPSLDGAGNLYIGGYGDNGLLKLNTEDGSLIWNLPMTGAPRNTPAIHPNGNIYVGTRADYFYGVSPEGEELWSRNLGAEIRTSAAVAPNGELIVGTYDGYIYSLDPDNGRPSWRTRVGVSVEGSPVVDAAGTIFAGGSHSPFTALDSSGNILYQFGGQVTDGVVSIDGDGRLYAGSQAEIEAWGSPRPRIRVHAKPRIVHPGEELKLWLVIENNTGEDLSVDQRVWIEGPEEMPVKVQKRNSVLLAEGMQDSSLVAQFNVPGKVVGGAYRVEGRLIEPETGWTLSHFAERFEVEPSAEDSVYRSFATPGE